MAVAGLVIGSFLNVVIHRLPRMIDAADGASPTTGGRFDLMWPPSHCPACERPIPPWENVPLISFVLSAGRCRGCGGAISWRYPLVEASAASLPVAFLPWAPDPAAAWAVAVLIWFLIPLVVIDLRERLLPDALTFPLAASGMIAALTLRPFVAPLDAVIGLGAGYAALAGLGWGAERVMGRPAMGLGDAKLLAALGAWFGWQALAPIVFAATAIGTAVSLPMMLVDRGETHREVPFGPFLALGGLLVMTRPEWFRVFGLGHWVGWGG